MNLLLTGATGFIGRHLVPRLLNRGHQVTVVVRNLESLAEFSWAGAVTGIEHDLQAPLGRWPNTGPPFEVAAHLAWPGLPHYQEKYHLAENLPAAEAFLKSLLAAGVPRLLVTGTCFEYGLQEGSLAENQETSPVTAYGSAKDQLRRNLQQLQQKKEFTLQWARLFYMFGPGQNSRSLLAQLDGAIAAGADEFPLSGGKQLRDYLPVEKVADYLVMLLESPSFDGIVNICSGTPISIGDLVAQHLAGKNATIKLDFGHYPYPQHEPMAFWGDNSKLSELNSRKGHPEVP